MGDRALAVTDIVSTTGWYDYTAKYSPGGSRHILPAEIPDDVAEACRAHALACHRALGCRGVSRTDLRWDEAKGVEGLIVAKCQRDGNADLYQARVSTDGINWQWMGASRTSTVKIFNCPVDVPLQVQMRCENKHGVGPWSTPVLAKIGVAGTIASMHA